MNRLILTICVFTLGCNSVATNDNFIADTSGHKAQPTFQPAKNIAEIKKPAIILDTLIFMKNMNGEMLSEKFKASHSQLNYYKMFINPKRINKLKIIKDKHTKTEIKYLGEIRDLDKINSYHVITNFTIWGIGQMLSPRGSSKIAFINKNKIVIYDMPMPYDLPKYIQRNVLYFQFEKTKIGISILGGLPRMLCVPEIGCN